MVSHPHTLPSHPGETPQPQRTAGLLGHLPCLPLSIINEEILGDPLLANGNDCFPVVASRQGGADFLMCSCASNGGSDQEDLEPWPVLPKHPAISYEPGYRRRIRARARIPVASRAAALGSGTDGVTGPTSTSPLVCGGPGSLTAFISYRKRPKRSPSG